MYIHTKDILAHLSHQHVNLFTIVVVHKQEVFDTGNPGSSEEIQHMTFDLLVPFGLLIVEGDQILRLLICDLPLHSLVFISIIYEFKLSSLTIYSR